MYINLHIIQNFPASNLNRDDTGAPKECRFGGYRRSRISSQCQKRSMRTNEVFKEAVLKGGGDLGVRTKRLIGELEKHFAAAGKPEGERAIVAEAVVLAIGPKKDDEKTEYLLYIGTNEQDEIVKYALSKWDDLLSQWNDTKADKEGSKKKNWQKKQIYKDFNKEIKKIITEMGFAADIAMFGRMVSDNKNMNVDAACQVAHAISTHKAGIETDYYTAVDDLLPEGESGSDMIGVIEYNSACYYKYANINVEKLRENLGGSGDLLQATIHGFVRSAIESVPTGMQNSFAAHTPPCYIEVTFSDAPVSYANAFSKPVEAFREVSIEESSINALKTHSERNETFFGKAPQWRLVANYFTEGLTVPALLAELDGHLKDL